MAGKEKTRSGTKPRRTTRTQGKPQKLPTTSTDGQAPKRIAIILGAGASAGYGLPTLGSLPQAVKDFVRSTKSDDWHALYDRVAGICESLWNRNPGTQWIDYERLLGVLEYLVRTKGSLQVREDGQRVLATNELIDSVYRELPRLLYTSIEHAQTANQSHMLQTDVHEVFFDKLVTKHRTGDTLQDLPDISVISMNYDSIVDTELTDHMTAWYPKSSLSEGGIVDYLPDYFIDFALVTNPKWFERGRTMPYVIGGKHHLIKLHGSFDWRICNHCGAVHYYRFWNTFSMAEDRGYATGGWETRLATQTCIRCKTPYLRARLVAPVLGKSDSDIAQTLWRRAFEKIAGADYLYIIGYSFPPSDSAFVTLVQHGLSWNEHQPEVHYVDSSSDEQFWQRVLEIFTSQNIRQVYAHKETFEDYVAGMGERAFPADLVYVGRAAEAFTIGPGETKVVPVIMERVVHED